MIRDMLKEPHWYLANLLNFHAFSVFIPQYQHRVLGTDEEGDNVSFSNGCAEHTGSTEISGASC